MKILYALIFVCLSLQAWVGQSATSAVSTSANECSSTNQLEFEGTSSDDAYTGRLRWRVDHNISWVISSPGVARVRLSRQSLTPYHEAIAPKTAINA